jgi:hypothetical protein
VELELLRHVHDREDHGGTEHTTEEWSVGPILIKRGLLPNLDLEVALEPYRDVRETTREAGVTRETRRQGFGDVAFRAKLNLWGNDDSPTALGLLPFLVLPTSQDGLGAATAGGGILLPFYLELPHAFELGAQTGAMGSGDGEADEARAGLVNSVTLGRSFGRRLSAYVEFWSLVDPATPAEWQGTFDFGLNVWLGDNLKFDAGLNLGVTEAAPDFNPFVGVSWRH